ncbi:DUF2267 domain-containing protein [Streptomyces albovinaceus]|uniref:DUF2267 domain-containing protein n=1 Tax=Streptomyces albovinaceus TaxID=66867 RepID=UPI000D1B5776
MSTSTTARTAQNARPTNASPWPAALPEEAARVFTADVPAVKQLAGAAFVAELAERTGGTPATARWDAGVVLSQIATLVGDDLVAEVVSCLPPGYALLFGRAELLTQAA